MNAKKSGGAGKWLMLGGCGCLFVGLGCGGFMTLLFTGIRTLMIRSDSYEIARSELAASREAEEAIGDPVEVGLLFLGSVSIANGRETADYSFPVSGPNGKGRVYVRGECEHGECDFQRLELTVGSRRIDLQDE